MRASALASAVVSVLATTEVGRSTGGPIERHDIPTPPHESSYRRRATLKLYRPAKAKAKRQAQRKARRITRRHAK